MKAHINGIEYGASTAVQFQRSVIGTQVLGAGTPNIQIFLNGVNDLNTSAAGPPATAYSWYIGALNEMGAPINYFKGKIAEIIVYDYAVDIPTRQAVETYLADKWMGALALPAAPTGASATTSTNNLDSLTWDPVAGATHYRVVYKSGVDGGNCDNIDGIVDAHVTTTSITAWASCGPGMQYFRICACNASNNCENTGGVASGDCT